MIFIKDFMQYLSFYLKDWHKHQVTGSEYALPFFYPGANQHKNHILQIHNMSKLFCFLLMLIKL